jgi:hypothetical protein
MAQSRSHITKGLSKLLVNDILLRKYWASEVTFDWGLVSEGRVDFISFKPANQSTSGIEQGLFSAYEVKSCLSDYRSKNGHNMIGDRNYYVIPMELYIAIVGEIPFNVGVYSPIPFGRTPLQEFSETTPFEGDTDGWSMKCIKNAHKTWRKLSYGTLLFLMLRSGFNRFLLEIEGRDSDV